MTERPAIPQESVSSAAESLVAANRAPSVSAVADMLGTDDLSAVMPRLQFWRMNRALKSAPHGALTEALVRSLDALGDDIGEISDRAVTKAASAAETTIQQVKKASDATIKTLTEKEAKATQDLAALNGRLDVLEAEAAKVKALGARITELESSLSEADTARNSARTRAEELGAEVSSLKERAEAAEAGQEKMQADLYQTMEERDSARQTLEAAEQTVAHLEQQISEQNAAVEEMQREAEDVQNRMKAEGYWLLDETDMSEVPKRLALATVRMSSLKAERDGLKEHLADVQHRLDQALKLLEVKAGSGPTILAHAAPAQAQVQAGGKVEKFPSGGGAQIEVVR